MKYKDFLNNELKNDKKFKKEYDKLENEYKIINQVIGERIKQNITQKELAKKTNIPQSNISRFETGNLNPSVKFLEKLANGLGKKLEISIK